MQGLTPYQYFTIVNPTCLYCNHTSQIPQHYMTWQLPTSLEQLPMIPFENLPFRTQVRSTEKQLATECKLNVQNSSNQWLEAIQSPKREKKPKVQNRNKQERIPERQQILQSSQSEWIKPKSTIRYIRNQKWIKEKQENLSKSRQYIRQYTKYQSNNIQWRNGITHILKQFIKGLTSLEQFDEVISKIFTRLGLSCQLASEFYQWIRSFKINVRRYIKTTLVLDMMDECPREDFKKVMRIFYFRFLHNQSLNNMLTSKKHRNKAGRLLGRRALFIELKQYLKEKKQ